MRLDSHQHFWNYNDTDYVWMSEEMNALRQNFLPERLQPQLKALGFGGSIAVQARQMLSETQWLLELANHHPFIQGVVGWVDFNSRHLVEQLELFTSHKKLKGVRELIHDIPDIHYATSSAHRAAISQLARFGLTYDLLLKPVHILPALELVRNFSEQLFVVDHMAKPLITPAGDSKWEKDFRELAKCTNVYCKLSGMVTEAAWNNWKSEEFVPYLDIALEAFGPNRLMIGSDWPVCTLSGTYEEVMGVVIGFVDKLTESERFKVLGGTCAEFYGIKVEDESSESWDMAGVQW